MNESEMKLAKKVAAACMTCLLLGSCSVQALPAQIHPFEPIATEPAQEQTLVSATVPPESGQAEPVVSFDESYLIQLQTQDGTIELSLHDYLLGVLYAEMPQSFSEQAMMAQAVASRTFALKKLRDGRVLCDQAASCQAYLDPAGLELPVAEAAVTATDGQVVTYGGALIEATFFSCSGGWTEAAVEVWGNDVAYLQSVQSPGEEEAPRFTETVTIPMAAVREALSGYEEADFTRELLVGEIVRTEGSGVRTIELAGVTLTGVQVRALFNLRSTNFEITESEAGLTFTTLGYGHRVGLSQYGAEAMAQQGASYEQILEYYYTGVEIEQLP